MLIIFDAEKKCMQILVWHLEYDIYDIMQFQNELLKLSTVTSQSSTACSGPNAVLFTWERLKLPSHQQTYSHQPCCFFWLLYQKDTQSSRTAKPQNIHKTYIHVFFFQSFRLLHVVLILNHRTLCPPINAKRPTGSKRPQSGSDEPYRPTGRTVWGSPVGVMSLALAGNLTNMMELQVMLVL